MSQPVPPAGAPASAKRRSLSGAWRRARGRARPALRLAAGLALLAAIWGPVWARSGPGPRAVILDRRQSFAPRLPAAKDRLARLDQDLRPPPTLRYAQEPASLLAALTRAVDEAGRRGGDVVLASNGRLPPRALLDIAARARALDVPIHTLCPPAPEVPLAAVEAVRGPRRVRRRDTVRLEATLAWNGWIAAGERAGAPLEIGVELRAADGRVVARAPLVFPATGGRERVVLAAPAAELTDPEGGLAIGIVRLRAPWQPAEEASGAGDDTDSGAAAGAGDARSPGGAISSAASSRRSVDPVPTDDAATWAAWVEPGVRTALWIRGPGAPGPGPLAVDEKVRVAEPAALPRTALGLAPYRVVVLDGVPAALLPPGAAEALRAFLEAGGGLVVCGARHAFGPGGYAGDEIDALLPVDSAPGGETARRLALCVCLDRSGSMARPSALGRSKLQAATDAVLAAAERLGPQDRLAILAFSVRVAEAWPLAPVEPRRVAALRRALERWEPDGATDLYPALLRAIRIVRGADVGARGARHVLVVSDGRSDATPDAEQALQKVLRSLGEAGAPRVTVSVVVVGRDADAARLGQLALAGGGRLLLVGEGADAIERAVRQEADPRRLELLARGPRALAPGPRWDRLATKLSVAALAPVSAAARTRAREGAEVLVRVPDIGPAFCLGRRGAGRVAALPIDGGAARARLVEAARSLVEGTQEDPRVGWEIRADRPGAPARVRVDVGPEAAVAWHEVQLRIGGALLGPLEEVAPGVYEAAAPATRRGPVLLSVLVDGALAARGVLPSPVEAPSTAAPDRALLRSVATRTGGTSLDRRRARLPRRLARGADDLPLRPWLALLAAALFVCDLAAASLARHAG